MADPRPASVIPLFDAPVKKTDRLHVGVFKIMPCDNANQDRGRFSFPTFFFETHELAKESMKRFATSGRVLNGSRLLARNPAKSLIVPGSKRRTTGG